MRILFLGPYPPPFGGVQTHLVGLREFLRARGVESSVINITGTRRADADGVHYPRSATEVARLLHSIEADIIHLHLGGDLTPRLQALLLVCTAVPGRKTVLTFHSGGYPHSAAARTARAGSVRGFIFRRLDALIAVNAELVRLFQRFGVPADRCHLIPPFAFATTGDPSRTPLSGALEAFVAEHDPLLLSVGLLEPEYDLPLQIRALGEVRREHPEAGLLIIGSGSLDAELRSLAAAQPHAAHIRLAGDVQHAETLAAISRARILLRTTAYDGDAISVREALHLGTTVVATDNGMRPDGVRLFPVGDLHALVRSIEAVLAEGQGTPGSDTSHARGVREGGADNFLAVLQLYERVLGRAPARVPAPTVSR